MSFIINKIEKKQITLEEPKDFKVSGSTTTLTKGDKVMMLDLTDPEGLRYFGIKKGKREGLILFKPETFDTFDKFLGAF